MCPSCRVSIIWPEPCITVGLGLHLPARLRTERGLTMFFRSKRSLKSKKWYNETKISRKSFSHRSNCRYATFIALSVGPVYLLHGSSRSSFRKAWSAADSKIAQGTMKADNTGLHLHSIALFRKLRLTTKWPKSRPLPDLRGNPTPKITKSEMSLVQSKSSAARYGEDSHAVWAEFPWNKLDYHLQGHRLSQWTPLFRTTKGGWGCYQWTIPSKSPGEKWNYLSRAEHRLVGSRRENDKRETGQVYHSTSDTS